MTNRSLSEKRISEIKQTADAYDGNAIQGQVYELIDEIVFLKATKKSVVQDWVADNCSWKEQTVLLCGLRGPDSGSVALKPLTRWLRSVTLENASPKEKFMREIVMPNLCELPPEADVSLDSLSIHAFSHLMHAFQIVAVCHPVENTANEATRKYFEFCEFMHVRPEHNDAMAERLRDLV